MQNTGIAIPQIERYVKNKQDFSDFSASHVNFNSNVFCFIDHNIITICLRGALLNNYEKGQGLEPSNFKSSSVKEICNERTEFKLPVHHCTQMR